MKRCFCFLLLCAFIALACAELRTISTKYFYIIYDNTYSENAANYLANNADRIADEVFDYYVVKAFKTKTPVYLKAHQEKLNGYFTLSPYRHIVLYDSLPLDDLISNNSENLLTVFKHEFAHAVSIRSFLNFNFPLAVREGLAVLSESMNGEGRLNDPRVLQIIRQDKIDGTLPKWNDLDMRDTYPSGTLGYVYGAAFAKFLSRVYGDKKYAEFINMHPKLFSKNNFKRAFGKSVDDLLAAFYQTVNVPERVEKPNYFFSNPKKSIYTATAAYENSFVVADKNEASVYLYRPAESPNKIDKKEKLFSLPFDVYNLNFSRDGKLLLVSTFYYQHDEVKSVVYVYDFANRKFLNERYYSIRYACFSENSKYILASESLSQNVSLYLIDRKTKEKKSLLELKPNSDYTNIFSLACVAENKYAVVLGRGIKRDIFFIDEDGNLEKLKLAIPAKAISNLSSVKSESADGILFSFILDESLLRFAYYDIRNKILKVLDKDISGGTNFPICIKNEVKDPTNVLNENATSISEKKFLYVANHSRYDFLCTIHESQLLVSEASLEEFQIKTVDSESPRFENKKYNPIMKMWKPSISPSIRRGSSFKNTSYGLKFFSQDVIDRLSYHFFIAIMPVPLFVQTEFTGILKLKGNELSLSVYDVSDVLNKNDAIRRSGFGIKNSKTIYIAKNKCTLSFETDFAMSWLSFIDLHQKNIYSQKYNDNCIYVSQSIELSDYRSRERLGNRFFAKDIYGFENMLNVAFAYNFKKKTPSFIAQDLFAFKTPLIPLNLELSASLSYKSELNPISAQQFFLNSNIPLCRSILPAMREHQNYYRQKSPSKELNLAFAAKSTLRIFSLEIQKTSSYFALCYNRFIIDIGYKALVNFAFTPEQVFLNSAFASLSIVVNGMAKLGISYSHPLRRDAKIGKFDLLFNYNF